jgi:hypothetical protein
MLSSSYVFKTAAFQYSLHKVHHRLHILGSKFSISDIVLSCSVWVARGLVVYYFYSNDPLWLIATSVKSSHTFRFCQCRKFLHIINNER